MPQIQSVLTLQKQIGETPLECIKRFQATKPEYKDVPMTYAGRLEPMAEGLLLVLAGEECKQKEKYLCLDKEYIVEILFGFATDSYDILGKVADSLGGSTSKQLPRLNLLTALNAFVGKFVQKYPKYSSKNIKKVLLSTMVGNSTFSKNVEIYSIKFLGQRKIGAKKLLSTIEERVSKVNGDFRQKLILALWHKNLKGGKNKYQVVKIKVKCSAGTYMRSLAHNLGKKLGVPALAFSIKRTKIHKDGSI